MKKEQVQLYAGLLLSLIAASGCQSNKGPVPEAWYLLPENGQAKSPGSLDQLGKVFDQLLVAHTVALDQIEPLASSATPPDAKPADWVPWRLAIFSSDFAMTTDGMFGALSSQGSASIAATWVKQDSLFSATRHPMSPKLRLQKSNVLMRGTMRPQELAQQLEPSIQAALASGYVTNEENLRKTVAGLGENFRAMAAGLSNLNLAGSAFKPSAFRVEISLDGEGNVTPLIGVGAALNLRFDWIIHDKSDPALVSSKVAQNLRNFVLGITPDLNEALLSADSIRASGFKLSSVRVGLILTSDFNVAIAQGSAESIASIVFGDNDEEGGCDDPDGDGDCHNHGLRLANADQVGSPLSANDDGVQIFVSTKKKEKIAYALANHLNFRPTMALQSDDGQVYKISHDKLQAGLKRAIAMSGFFTSHASALGSSWKIKELEAEFDLSLSGDFGFATIGGGGEVELEFENRGI